MLECMWPNLQPPLTYEPLSFCAHTEKEDSCLSTASSPRTPRLRWGLTARPALVGLTLCEGVYHTMPLYVVVHKSRAHSLRIYTLTVVIT